ncbi:MAG TPA: glycine cleavage system protein GcvH [Ignavibacteria bacterium]
MNIPENLKYTKDHEWLKLEDNVGTIGITDYAQKELGDIIYLDITASVGDVVKQGGSIGTIEAVKTVSEVFSPISGRIIDINTAINDNPSVINQDPYIGGWIVKIEPDNQDELNNLLDVNAYKEVVA